MKHLLKTITLSLVLFSGAACTQDNKSLQVRDEVVGIVGSETVTYMRYNTEEQPCITLRLENADVSKTLCKYTDQQGNTVDVTTDVAAIDYLSPTFTADGLEVTLDLISYYLDCRIQLTETTIGEPVCTFKDMD
ncbi:MULTISPECIES: hypothetical protein [unclassified Agarivorans]|uniref:hypothetical protein n=1 Tax=unclassified Agarivorans TaxID=2636026 RepID=UPI0026E3F3B2|nr:MULTISPECIES: hypothetical protein [unclassified Agarivorans]MDO6683862.1 hypothetical protein [Agarivorans sp. 3_MG-2023]MDO6714405.1 hypothetical protein [Agarivorans sp. 2_MG-2023]